MRAIRAKAGENRLPECKELGEMAPWATTFGVSAGKAFADCTSPAAHKGPYHAVFASTAKRMANTASAMASVVRRQEKRSANLPDIMAVYHAGLSLGCADGRGAG